MFGWREFARRLTPALVTLWVAFLVLGTLQPCCEALADTFMEAGYAPVQDHHHELLGDVDPHTIGDQAPIHTHCGETVVHAHLTALSASEPGQWGDAHPAAIAALLPLPSSPVSGPQAPDASASNRERSPPLPVYLATLRLRI